MKRTYRRASLLIIAGLHFLNASSIALSMNEGSVEYPLKLVFLFNFTKYVEWPSDVYKNPGDPLSICIVGDDPFAPDLEEALRARKVGGHPVEVRQVKPGDMLRACHIVFIPATANARARDIVKELNGTSTLTVGETEGFAALGGIMNFKVEANRLRFEVNSVAAKNARLKISSRLLSIATIVNVP
jgi:uncharacterized protein DUF4154